MSPRRSGGPGQPVRRLLSATDGRSRGFLAATVLLGLAVTAAILAQAGLLAHALAAAAAGTGAAALRATLIALLAVVIGRAIAASGAEAAALRGAAAVKQRLRTRLVRHALALGPTWLGGQRDGEITALATGGLDALDSYFARYLPQLTLAVAVPFAVVVAVTSADWLSGVIIAVTLPLVPLFGALIGLHTRAQTRQSWQALARLSGHFLDVVQGLATLKAYGRASAQEQVIARVTGEYRRSVMATLRVAFMSALVLELSAALATALVAVEVGIRLLYGHLGYATALFVLLLTPEAFLPLRNAAAAFHASADGTAAARRAFEILDEPLPGPRTESHGEPGGQRRPAPADPDLRSQTIMLNGITVAYPGRGQPVLRGVNLTIGPGELITLAGPNGAGKSSLLSLLLGFTRPADGEILIGDVALTDLPADRWRSQIGWLPQRPALFGWTVADNIALGDPAASPAAIERAAALAGAAGFIEELPDGYDTVLDERALRLSAGQRQKIALARLFLRDAPLLLLDEPTAHLDPASAADVDATIGTLAAGRTVIVVSHRDLAARQPSGRLVHVSDGAVTEATPAVSAGPPPAARLTMPR